MNEEYDDYYEEPEPSKTVLPAWTSTYWPAGQTWIYAPVELLGITAETANATSKPEHDSGGANSRMETSMDRDQVIQELREIAIRGNWPCSKYFALEEQLDMLPAMEFREKADDLLRYVRLAESRMAVPANLEFAFESEDVSEVALRVEAIDGSRGDLN